MAVRLVFLGRLADLAGREEAEIDFGSPLDWSDICAWCSDCYSPDLMAAMMEPKVKVALNGQLVADKEDVQLADGDELALLPPVSGG